MQIKKWQVFLADLNPRRGTEPGKIRPVVVVQTNLLNSTHPSTVVCPLTSHVEPRTRVLRVHLVTGEAGLATPSDVMVDQIRAIDNRRLIRPLGMIHPRSRLRLTENLRVLLA